MLNSHISEPTMNQTETEHSIKYQRLQSILQGLGRAVIAFSGGVDSTLLLKVARDILDKNILAVTAVSETIPKSEQDEAARIADLLDVKLLLTRSNELSLSVFTANPENKCYICKKNRYGDILAIARRYGYPHVIEGVNADDHNDYRPGIQAARELGILSPLAEAGLTKREVRQLSKCLGLDTWDKPAAACLASRIPYHSPITKEKLRQIELGEKFLQSAGINGQVRVRHHGNMVRIEMDPEFIPQVADPAFRLHLVTYFRSLGFTYVSVDLEGYNTGSLNRDLKKKGE